MASAGATDSSIDGKVALVEHLGSSTLLHVDTAAGQLIVEGEGNLKIAVGETVGLTIDKAASHLFAPDGRVI